jgi:hypothetical protein
MRLLHYSVLNNNVVNLNVHFTRGQDICLTVSVGIMGIAQSV